MYWIPIMVIVLTVKFLFSTVVDGMKLSDQAKIEKREEQAKQFMDQYCDKKLEAELMRWLEQKWDREVEVMSEFLDYDYGADKIIVNSRYIAALMVLLAERGKVYSGMCGYGIRIITGGKDKYYDAADIGLKYLRKLEETLHEHGVPAVIFGRSYDYELVSIHSPDPKITSLTDFYYVQTSVYFGDNYLKKYGRG